MMSLVLVHLSFCRLHFQSPDKSADSSLMTLYCSSEFTALQLFLRQVSHQIQPRWIAHFYKAACWCDPIALNTHTHTSFRCLSFRNTATDYLNNFLWSPALAIERARLPLYFTAVYQRCSTWYLYLYSSTTRVQIPGTCTRTWSYFLNSCK